MQTIYVTLLGEGVSVWRPVWAEHVSGDCYRIVQKVGPETERWEFPPGSMVRCAEKIFQDGKSRLVAFQAVDAPDEATLIASDRSSDFSQPAKLVHRRNPLLAPALFWLFVVAIAAFALVCEILFSMFLFFTGGWANGWPGLSFRTVSATVITLYIALELMTVATAVGAIVGFICALFRMNVNRQFRIYGGWLLFAALVVLCLSFWNFRYYYLEAGDGPYLEGVDFHHARPK
jgi:hypothetical protein